MRIRIWSISSFCFSTSNCTLQHCYLTVSLEIGCQPPTYVLKSAVWSRSTELRLWKFLAIFMSFWPALSLRTIFFLQRTLTGNIKMEWEMRTDVSKERAKHLITSNLYSKKFLNWSLIHVVNNFYILLILPRFDIPTLTTWAQGDEVTKMAYQYQGQ